MAGGTVGTTEAEGATVDATVVVDAAAGIEPNWNAILSSFTDDCPLWWAVCSVCVRREYRIRHRQKGKDGNQHWRWCDGAGILSLLAPNTRVSRPAISFSLCLLYPVSRPASAAVLTHRQKKRLRRNATKQTNESNTKRKGKKKERKRLKHVENIT